VSRGQLSSRSVTTCCAFSTLSQLTNNKQDVATSFIISLSLSRFSSRPSMTFMSCQMVAIDSKIYHTVKKIVSVSTDSWVLYPRMYYHSLNYTFTLRGNF